MSKKTLSKKRTNALKNTFLSEKRLHHEKDYGDILRNVLTSPMVKYVASGIAAAYLLRLANNIHEKYPEISKFIKENMDMLEEKLHEYKGQIQHKNELRETH